MIAVVLNLAILLVCGIVIVRSPRRSSQYWVTVVVWVVGVLLLSGLATQLLGGTAGAVVFVACLVIGYAFVRPHLARWR